MNELTFAKKLAINAGKKCLEVYKNFTFEDIVLKKDKSPLTLADTLANNIIISKIKKIFPDDAILSEEEKDDLSRLKKNRIWIIDPLDGTKEFIKKNGEFTVNIALIINCEPVLGVIYVPVTKELFYAKKDCGAFLNNHSLKVTKKNIFSEMKIVTSRSHMNDNLTRLINELGFASKMPVGSSLKGCLVAKGDAEVYIRLGPTNEWDIAAMNIIINEAGGVMTDLNNNTLIYNQKNTLKQGFILSNNTKHEEMIKVIRKWKD